MWIATAIAGCTSPKTTANQSTALVDEVCALVNEHFHDQTLKGVDWVMSRDRCLRRISETASSVEVVASINAMLAELRTSHTHVYASHQLGYYELLDIYRDVLGEELKRVFPHGTVTYPRSALQGERAGRPPTEYFLEATRRSTRVFVEHGRRIGYVHMPCWAGDAFQDLLEELLNTDPLAECEGLILDIRGGWGGANPQAIGLFGRKSPSLEFIARDGTVSRTEGVLPTTAPERQWLKPTVLLVDESTRSGKEVFAYAFQRRSRGLIIGAPTAGAVVGGKPFLLQDGSLLIVATHDVRVDGRRLEGVGVQPDILVEQRLHSEDPHRDTPLERAFEALSAALQREPNPNAN